jgi:beta-xylosidase
MLNLCIMKQYKYFILLLITLNSSVIFAQNPILIGLGVSDPHIRVFNDTIYLYSGHDATPDDKIWTMRDWRVFSTTDLINWKIRYTISPKENYMADNSTDCWASDAASRNGKYYFYFSDQKRGVGVMTSDTPTGPFIDPLNKPLVAPMHDPTIFIDDNEQKTPYLVYGDKEGGGFHIAKLNEDMIATSETPKQIVINGKEWEDAPHWMDKNYLFKHNDTYYLSWGKNYATSKNVYGPYESVGPLGEGHHLSELAHGSFFKWKGQFYHIWCYYLRNGYKYRECIITYCHMDDEGKIVTDVDFLDQHFSNGVGQYNASWDKIEAEWFYQKSEGIQKQGTKSKGFVLSNFKDGDWIKYANVTFDKSYEKLVANLNFEGKKGVLEIRTDSLKGKRIGKIKLNSKNTSKAFQELSFNLKAVKGKKDLFIKFRGEEGSTLTLDWVKFK